VVPRSRTANGVPAVLKHVHGAGSQIRAALELVSTRESIEVELSRAEFLALNPKIEDVVAVRLRPTQLIAQDYTI
jgi:sulfate/thiosulfate transport system ATP-binding protein